MSHHIDPFVIAVVSFWFGVLCGVLTVRSLDKRL